MSKNNFIIIDVQGFFLDNKFIAKEICIFEHNQTIKKFIIYPPCKFSSLSLKEKITNNWLTKHFHGLRWNDGNIIFKEFNDYLNKFIKKQENLTIFVKGCEKQKWIKQLIEEDINIINLDDANCSNICNLYKNNLHMKICSYHKQHPNYRCAEKNVILLSQFINVFLK